MPIIDSLMFMLFHLFKYSLNCYLHNKNNVQHQKTPFSSLELLELVTEELMWLNFVLGLSQIIPWNLPVLHDGLQSPVSIQGPERR